MTGIASWGSAAMLIGLLIIAYSTSGGASDGKATCWLILLKLAGKYTYFAPKDLRRRSMHLWARK